MADQFDDLDRAEIVADVRGQGNNLQRAATALSQSVQYFEALDIDNNPNLTADSRTRIHGWMASAATDVAALKARLDAIS